MLKLLEIILRHNSRNRFFFLIFRLGNIFETFDWKGKKRVVFFLPKINFLAIFGQYFQKCALIKKFEKKKPFTRQVSQYDFQAILIFFEL